MSRLIIHIGLPKTATTSLQKELFNHLPNLNYLGVNQPRKLSIQNQLYNEILQFIDSGDNISKVKLLIKLELQKGRNLLLSEEMFVVSNKISWKVKLGHLEKLIEGFDYKILVTVREPIKAMFSYYVERYVYFNRLNREFSEIASSDESMKIYHYKYFFSFLLKSFDKEFILVKKFEDLINNEFDDVIDFLEAQNTNVSTKLQNNNSKKKSEKFICKQVTKNYGNLIVNKKKGWRINHFANYIFSHFGESIKNKVLALLQIKSYVRIKKPDDIVVLKLSEYLEKDNEFLLENFGIKY